jgi:hypothetical protein
LSRLSVTWAAVIFAFTGPMTKACDLQGYLFVVALAAIFFRVNISLYCIYSWITVMGLAGLMEARWLNLIQNHHATLTVAADSGKKREVRCD